MKKKNNEKEIVFAGNNTEYKLRRKLADLASSNCPIIGSEKNATIENNEGLNLVQHFSAHQAMFI